MQKGAKWVKTRLAAIRDRYPTMVNGKPWRCNNCGGERLLYVEPGETSITYLKRLDMRGDHRFDYDGLPQNECDGPAYFHCDECPQAWSVNDIESLVGVGEEDEDEE